VRGVALRELTARAGWDAPSASLARLALVRCLSAAEPPLVVKVALSCVPTWVTLSGERDPADLWSALVVLAGDARAKPDTAERAAALLHALEVRRRPELAQLAVRCREALAQLAEGQSVQLVLAAPERDVVQALRVAARGNHAV